MRSERTLLYRLVAEHYPRFLALLAGQDRSLPLYVQRELDDFIKCGQAGCILATTKTGAVTLIQRFGSALNLNIHL